MLAIVFVLIYIGLHGHYRHDYLEHIGPNIANSVMMYGIQAHEQTGELVLSLAEKPFSMADAEPGPLGIGDLAATRGWLIQSSNVVKTYNARLKAYVERLLAQFHFSRNRPNFVIADLSSIAQDGISASQRLAALPKDQTRPSSALSSPKIASRYIGCASLMKASTTFGTNFQTNAQPKCSLQQFEAPR